MLKPNFQNLKKGNSKCLHFQHIEIAAQQRFLFQKLRKLQQNLSKILKFSVKSFPLTIFFRVDTIHRDFSYTEPDVGRARGEDRLSGKVKKVDL